ncbi:ABC transporter permease [Pollutimonas bauzanensis]|uniref:Pyoverdine export ATP-binding/permease protein PvdT n=1 Tax=Pollutimonas bauzanensis TaxID=658167 RepID=A0A1M5Z6H2_9BURK|nr:ABC transporter permease [Pollutimonas bauzanensis]SHI19819.1 macrolide transport system ATP-binding/permease protein [Pollutimonas bauzanensis]
MVGAAASLQSEPDPVPLIELRGIRKQYGGKDGVPAVEVLHGIDLSVRAGEFVAIMGQSGSGKSTLMHILGCLDRASSGAYRFSGRDVSTLDADALAWLRREAFGFVFQGYHLIATESARENVEVPAIYAGTSTDVRAERAAVLLARLGLSERQNNRPRQLSGGQQQRVSIARALMNGGRIILADEPTGALDSQSGAEVMALFHELADVGHTVILITHDRQVAEQARRVIEIHDGRIVGDTQKADPEVAGGADESRTRALPALNMNAAHSDPGAGLAELQEALRTAWRGMRINRSRTFLTLLGIIIGVASVIVMLAIGEGARQRVMSQMGALGTTIMYMGSRAPPTGGPPGMLTEEDLAAIGELPDIRRVMPVIGDPLTLRYGNASREVYVFAADEDMPSIHHWSVGQGRFYTDAEDRDLAPLVVLGAKARAHFFGAADPVGEQLLIGSAPFEVIGVMAERGADSGAQNYDDMVFIPYRTGRARVYQAQAQPDYVVMEAASSGSVLAAEEAVRQLLLTRHGGREDFGIGNAAARLQAEAATRRSMTMMLGLIAAVSLLVGGIGVMNVMLMTVKERTREIGIRMATGARQRDILRQFLTEAMLLTVVGGALGLILGLLIGAALIAAEVPLVFSVTAMAGAFACAVVTGVLFGFMPARTAARLDPVVALAGE